MTIILISILLSLVNPLQEYKWENRVVLVFSDDQQKLNDQLDLLRADNPGLTNRDIRIFTIHNGGTNNNSWDSSAISWLVKNFNTQKDPFKVVLIGKDGSKKAESTKLITREVLFSIIDKMPMRRAEMKNDIREKGN